MRYLSHVLFAAALALAAGCKSLDQAAFQSLSAAGDKMAQSTRTSYTALEDLLRQKQRAFLLKQPDPPWVSNRAALLNPSLVEPRQVDARVKMAEALAAYAKKLSNLAAGPDLGKFDASVRAAADALAGFDTNALATLGFPKSITISTNQAEAAARIVQDVGHLLLEHAQKSQLQKLIAANSSTIDKFTMLLAKDIGSASDEGMRAVFHRSLLLRLQQVAGDMDEWKKGEKEREALLDNSIALAAQMQAQDDSLAALRDACLQFAVAHRQLLEVVRNSQSVSAERSIQALENLANDAINFANKVK
jgi:hypothetical protein